MLSILKYGYKATKPRVQTINTQSLQAYRKEMHEARIRAHKQAVKYLNRIQDQFIDKHKKKTAQEHFLNQCRFRAKIARNSYLLFEQWQKNKSRHQQKLQMMQKFIRGQQIKRLNRDRIRKILQYESANFWLNGDNVNQKIISERVLPQFIGSTEYYHKLHAQAFAYQQLDFNLLHKLSSNQQSTQYKNQLLVPIFKQLIHLMKQVKFTDQQRLGKQYIQNQIKTKNKYFNNEVKLKQQLQNLRKIHETNISLLKNKQTELETRKEYFKGKLKDLIVLLKKWKEYTDVLGMTSAQVTQIIEESRKESMISDRRKQLENQIEKNRDKTFVSAVEQDTQDQQFNLQNFLQTKTLETPAYQSKQMSEQDFNAELTRLLQKQKSIFEEITSQYTQKQQQSKRQQISVKSTSDLYDPNITQTEMKNMKIDQAYLKENQTTTSVELLKQEYQDDKSLLALLNIAGELTVEYPKLFRKIWDNQIL